MDDEGLIEIIQKDDIENFLLLIPKSPANALYWLCKERYFRHIKGVALHFAIYFGQLNMVRTILEEMLVVLGSIKEVDERVAPLIYASSQQNRKQVIQFLIARHCDVNHQLTDSGNTALHVCCSNRHPCCATIKLLIQSNANLNLANSEGYTPLHLLCLNSESTPGASALRILQDNGADIDFPTSDGLLPFQITKDYEVREMLRLSKYGRRRLLPKLDAVSRKTIKNLKTEELLNSSADTPRDDYEEHNGKVISLEDAQELAHRLCNESLANREHLMEKLQEKYDIQRSTKVISNHKWEDIQQRLYYDTMNQQSETNQMLMEKYVCPLNSSNQLDDEELDESVQRLHYNELQNRNMKMKSLQEKYLTNSVPSRKITKSKSKSLSDRLYYESLNTSKDLQTALSAKYLKPRTKSSMSKEQVNALTARLYVPSNV